METKPGNKRPTCYVYKSFRNKCVKPVLEHNTKLLKEASYAEKVSLLDTEFTRFEDAEAKAKDPWYYYRLHWSGDLFSEEYSKAIAEAVARHPKTTFWIYTRSFDYVEPLLDIPNLKVYLSLDQVNVVQGMATRAKFLGAKNLAISVMDKTLPDPSIPACPQDSGKIPLAGACRACGLCVNQRSDVWFKTK